MARRFRNVLLTLKPESTYGVDAGPTASANAFLCRELKFELVDDPLKRTLIKPTMGALPQDQVMRRYEIEVEVELQSSGTAGTAPAWGPLARACGMSETISTGTSVTYAPVSSAFESATAWFYADGVLHKATGVRGGLKISFPKNDYPLLQASLMGLAANPADGATPTPTLGGWKAPRAMGKDNTPTFTLHGYAGILRQLEIDMGQETVFRDLVGAKEVNITGREVTGECSLEAVSLAVKDWYAIARNRTLGSLGLVHGTAAGSIVEIAAPAVQVMSPGHEDEDDILYQSLKLLFTETSGDDEISLIAR